MLLSVIIVNYNVKFFVEQCLHSIYRSEGISPADFEVFVIDNLSKDESVAYLKKQFPVRQYPNLHLIANRRNIGFGRANNRAIRKAQGKYVLLLNPDTLLTRHTLADVLALAERTPGLGAMGAKMLYSNGCFALESRRGIPSPWVSFCKMSGLGALFPRSKVFGKYYMRYLPMDKPSEIDIVSGAFMLMPKHALDHTGGFDETFFMYGEDIDLSYRLKLLGYHNYYCPTPLLHYKGESTQKNSYRYVHVFYEAMLIFFQKHYRHYNIFLSLPIKAAILGRAVMALCSQQIRFFKKFLWPRHKELMPRMLYIGRASDQVRQLAEEYGLCIDYFSADRHSLPEGHLSPRIRATSYQIVVYDSDDFHTDDMLRYFEEGANKELKLGTYNPSRGVLITDSNTYHIG